MRGFTRRAVTVAAAAACAATALLSTATTAQAAPAHRSTYVSLGDSLAYGFQPSLYAAGATPAQYVGYAEDFAAMHPHMTLANFGCPGETSTSMLTHCADWASFTPHLAYDTNGSQLAAAVGYLAAHPDTSLVSIDIGSNDLLGAIRSCQAPPSTALLTCLQAHLPGVLATFAHNYLTILGAIHQAAPHATIVMFGLYNPLATALPGSDALLTDEVNPLIHSIAAGFSAATGAHVRVADAFSAINHRAGSRAEATFVCVRTWECSGYHDVHPTSVGYRQLAIAMLHALRH